jgi:hypothetical protein
MLLHRIVADLHVSGRNGRIFVTHPRLGERAEVCRLNFLMALSTVDRPFRRDIQSSIIIALSAGEVSPVRFEVLRLVGGVQGLVRARLWW